MLMPHQTQGEEGHTTTSHAQLYAMLCTLTELGMHIYTGTCDISYLPQYPIIHVSRN